MTAENDVPSIVWKAADRQRRRSIWFSTA